MTRRMWTRLAAIAALALCVAPESALAQKTDGKAKKTPPAKEVPKADPKVEFAKKFDAIQKKLDTANADFKKKMEAAKDDDEREKINESRPGPEFIAEFKALADEAKGTDIAAKSWCKVGTLGLQFDKSEEAEAAVGALLEGYITSPEIKELPLMVAQVYAGAAAEKAIADIAEKSPHKPVKAAALYLQAQSLEGKEEKSKKEDPEVRKAYERLAKEFGDEKPPFEDANYKSIVEGWLFVRDNLQIGKTAPDFEATDENGTKFKLSDYRGKVVVIDFWGIW